MSFISCKSSCSNNYNEDIIINSDFIDMIRPRGNTELSEFFIGDKLYAVQSPLIHFVRLVDNSGNSLIRLTNMNDNGRLFISKKAIKDIRWHKDGDGSLLILNNSREKIKISESLDYIKKQLETSL